MSAARTDRQKMNAAFRAMRAAGLDARHAAARHAERGVRLSYDPRDAYTSTGAFWGCVRVSWIGDSGDTETVLRCLRAEGLLVEALPPVPGGWFKLPVHAVAVSVSPVLLRAVVDAWTEDVRALAAVRARLDG